MRAGATPPTSGRFQGPRRVRFGISESPLFGKRPCPFASKGHFKKPYRQLAYGSLHPICAGNVSTLISTALVYKLASLRLQIEMSRLGGIVNTDNRTETVDVIRFKQWLPEWDAYRYSIAAPRRKPNEHIFMFAMPARALRQLCDVYRRSHSDGGPEGIQRARDDARTARIQQYVRYGYPYGDLKAPQRTPEMLTLRKPGWLPTALVLNILQPGDERRGRTLDPKHVVKIDEKSNGGHQLVLPDLTDLDEDKHLAPFEVIDGQHRLWAFDPEITDEIIPDDFEFPVVAFCGLDVAWQAYLFWSINVSPVKINQSHAFDLYPLLRNEEWLDRVGELAVYREARAQELTSLLQTHPESPWKGRINMLGERGEGAVSQASWVRNLIATFMAAGRGKTRPGLFQAALKNRDEPLEWSRAQQAAFIISLWRELEVAVQESQNTHAWIKAFETANAAIKGRGSLLNQDMGVRALLHVVNDIFYFQATEWKLDKWQTAAPESPETSLADVTDALDSFSSTQIARYISELAAELATYDWRSFDGPKLLNEQQDQKRIFRGSGGYIALRNDILNHIAERTDSFGQIAKILAAEVSQ